MLLLSLVAAAVLAACGGDDVPAPRDLAEAVGEAVEEAGEELAADVVGEAEGIADDAAEALAEEAAQAVREGADDLAERIVEEGRDVIVAEVADVVAVAVSGTAGAYTFNVTVSSPDTGCDRYADWWEVLSADGSLLYRRTVLHSHVDEQPFARSGGPVPVAADADVIVRAHMSVGGYGGAAMRGQPDGGLVPVTLSEGFATDVESMEPQPPDCAF